MSKLTPSSGDAGHREDDLPLETLTGSLREYRDPHGVDLFARVNGFHRWQDLRRRHGMWPYSKSTDEAPKPTTSAKDDAGRPFRGVNFASQDYLSLASHPDRKSTRLNSSHMS